MHRRAIKEISVKLLRTPVGVNLGANPAVEHSIFLPAQPGKSVGALPKSVLPGVYSQRANWKQSLECLSEAAYGRAVRRGSPCRHCIRDAVGASFRNYSLRGLHRQAFVRGTFRTTLQRVSGPFSCPGQLDLAHAALQSGIARGRPNWDSSCTIPSLFRHSADYLWWGYDLRLQTFTSRGQLAYMGENSLFILLVLCR